MNYIENIFLCLSTPLLVAILCAPRTRRTGLVFLLAGMTACLCASYISTFFAFVTAADRITAVTNITPMVEEVMKLLPLLFYLLVFEPRAENAAGSILMTALGFATFENVCYLTSNGAQDIGYLLIRGAGTGAMHIVCGMVMGLGLLALWDVTWLKFAGTLAFLGFVIVYHAIYNLLVSQTGAVSALGLLLPLVTVLLVLLGRPHLTRVLRANK